MANRFQFEFALELQPKREPILQDVRAAACGGTLAAVQAAQARLSAWLELHPDDYGLWDAGEPLALLVGALQVAAATASKAGSLAQRQ
jgi:hypothetical protein